MTWETVDGVFQIALDPLFTATAAAIFFVAGVAVKRYVAFLRRFCVPTALIGGWIAVFFTLSIRRYGVSVFFDTTLQTPMILAFFATVGIGGSLSFLTRRGWALVIYLAGCWGVAIFQNTLGVGLAKLFDLHAILGVMAGAVSLKGGHETAAVFGAAAENLGVAGAQVVAIASATYGLVAGGLLGGPLISWLIEHNKLEPTSRDDTARRRREEEAAVSMEDIEDRHRDISHYGGNEPPRLGSLRPHDSVGRDLIAANCRHRVSGRVRPVSDSRKRLRCRNHVRGLHRTQPGSHSQRHLQHERGMRTLGRPILQGLLDRSPLQRGADRLGFDSQHRLVYQLFYTLNVECGMLNMVRPHRSRNRDPWSRANSAIMILYKSSTIRGCLFWRCSA
jgi:hypothetical protein